MGIFDDLEKMEAERPRGGDMSKLAGGKLEIVKVPKKDNIRSIRAIFNKKATIKKYYKIEKSGIRMYKVMIWK